jgi:hypothetical protein
VYMDMLRSVNDNFDDLPRRTTWLVSSGPTSLAFKVYVNIPSNFQTVVEHINRTLYHTVAPAVDLHKAK